MRPKRRDALPDDLFPELLELLVFGWNGEHVPPAQRSDRFWDVFSYTPQMLAAVYREHAALIDAHAQGCGRARPWIAEQPNPDGRLR